MTLFDFSSLMTTLRYLVQFINTHSIFIIILDFISFTHKKNLCEKVSQKPEQRSNDDDDDRQQIITMKLSLAVTSLVLGLSAAPVQAGVRNLKGKKGKKAKKAKKSKKAKCPKGYSEKDKGKVC